ASQSNRMKPTTEPRRGEVRVMGVFRSVTGRPWTVEAFYPGARGRADALRRHRPRPAGGILSWIIAVVGSWKFEVRSSTFPDWLLENQTSNVQRSTTPE